MKTNIKAQQPKQFTHEGAQSTPVSALAQLTRSVMACMLWEDNFYEDGKLIVDRIGELCQLVHKESILRLAVQSHQKGYLRHVPLKLIVESLRKKNSFKVDSVTVSEVVNTVCNRPDQMTELLSLYWKDGKKPLAAQLKKGLAKAFTRFDEYQLSKYNRDEKIKLRDVLFLCHAKPKDKEQEALWKRLVNNELKTADTWETRLSSGADKKESFQELLMAGKMGKLAILRNLRNMHEAGIDKDLVAHELMKSDRPLLPFQFIAAAKHCPQWEDIVDKCMLLSLEKKEKLPGLTVIFVDVSGSMDTGRISAKSETSCKDAASGLCILLKEVCEKSEIWSFSNALHVIPSRSGMALRDAINNSQSPAGTQLGAALMAFNQNRNETVIDRLIVITDEQTHDVVPLMKSTKACYILNISTCQNGIKNTANQWTTISGFSEASIDYIRECENVDQPTTGQKNDFV